MQKEPAADRRKDDEKEARRRALVYGEENGTAGYSLEGPHDESDKRRLDWEKTRAN